MGLMNYFWISKPVAKKVETEKSPTDVVYGEPVKPIRHESATPSARSVAISESQLADDIRHQVLLNHLHQQQRSLLWIRDSSGAVEGVMIRKGRDNYMYSPPTLSTSIFAQAMKVLNVQVSYLSFRWTFPIVKKANVYCRLP